jgi:hypothetical protein
VGLDEEPAMILEAMPARSGVHRIVLQVEPEGTYIFVFERASSKFPERDYLQDDLAMAMRACEQDYGVGEDAWKEITEGPG